MGQTVPLYTTSGTASLQVDVECESCGHRYPVKIAVSQTSAAYFKADVAQDRMYKGLDKKVARFRKQAERGDYGWIYARACPACKYIQSWGLKRERSSRITTTIVLALFAAFVVSLALAMSVGPTWSLVAGAASAVLVVGLRIPRIQKLRRDRAPKELVPEVHW